MNFIGDSVLFYCQNVGPTCNNGQGTPNEEGLQVIRTRSWVTLHVLRGSRAMGELQAERYLGSRSHITYGPVGSAILSTDIVCHTSKSHFLGFRVLYRIWKRGLVCAHHAQSPEFHIYSRYG